MSKFQLSAFGTGNTFTTGDSNFILPNDLSSGWSCARNAGNSFTESIGDGAASGFTNSGPGCCDVEL
jgi:hypothetical protein